MSAGIALVNRNLIIEHQPGQDKKSGLHNEYPLKSD